MVHLVILRPRSPIGTWPTVQTIFGALCWSIRWLHGERTLVKLLDWVMDFPPCLGFSDFLPVIVGRERRLFLLPKPLSWNLVGRWAPEDLDAKRIKQAQWVTPTALAADPGELCVTGGVVCCAEEQEFVGKLPPAREIPRPHATVNRLTASTTAPGRLFFSSSWYLQPRVCMYVLVYADREWADYWLPALKAACDGGIGRKRGVGRGSFEVISVEECESPDCIGARCIEPPAYVLLLGRALASVGDMGRWRSLAESYYELVIEHGHADSGGTGIEVFRPSALYLKRGSVLKRRGGTYLDDWPSYGYERFDAGGEPHRRYVLGRVVALPLQDKFPMGGENT